MAKYKRNRRKKKEEEVLVDIVEAREQARDFFDRFQIPLIGGVLLVLVLIGGSFVYKTFFKEPKEREAVEQMFRAENMFQIDSFALALTGPGGGYPGFLDIVDQYGGTKAGNLAKYYAGISYLHLGEYDAAVDFLNEFRADGKVTPAMKAGAIGDAYSEKGDFEAALGQYQKAAKNTPNEFTSPYYLMKAGLLQERLGKPDEALKSYKEIQSKYPSSQQGQEVEKYIAKLGG